MEAEPNSLSTRRDDPTVPGAIWKMQVFQWLLIGAALALMYWIFRDGLDAMFAAWEREEYSHGFMLPFVAIYFVWQRSAEIARTQFHWSWVGIVVVLFGLFLYVVAELGTIYALIQYAFLITLGGTLLSLMGWQAFKIVAPAYALLFFTVPLPAFLYNSLSAELQLISSQIGVWVIRLFSVSVFLEGNVIDLGSYKLQVAEACSGLRYLFPLMALGYIAAYIFKGALWKKVLLFLATIPITVLMNSFRIGVIGVLVEYGGIEQAEGFLHDFEGWVVFMACALLLVLLMWLLARIGKHTIPLREAFAIEGPEPLPANAAVQSRRIPKSFYAVVPLMLIGAVVSQALPHREEVIPERASLLFFPTALGEWQGRTERMEQIYLDALKLDDYRMAQFSSKDGESINLYIAYYESQRKGASVHSPKSCLPGGGWEMQTFSQVVVPRAGKDGGPLRVNRSLIQMGDERLLVYYWFQQRGRFMTNEYLVKWFLFWDSLVSNRSDGALVRLTTRIEPGADVSEADRILTEFSQSMAPSLRRFIPE
ncbi:MAG: VPLPA-CTERM-specific exosortase XrtD [Thiohalocapsa sp.]